MTPAELDAIEAHALDQKDAIDRAIDPNPIPALVAEVRRLQALEEFLVRAAELPNGVTIERNREYAENTDVMVAWGPKMGHFAVDQDARVALAEAVERFPRWYGKTPNHGGP